MMALFKKQSGKPGAAVACGSQKNRAVNRRVPLKFLSCFIIIAWAGAAAFPALCAEEWKQIKGDHFIVYYAGDSRRFAEEVKRRAEDYYRLLADGLGYARYSNFWQWDNRVKIYLYETKSAYNAATGRPDWSHGMADYPGKTIFSYCSGQGFTDTLLPHEIGHLIFRDYVGFKGEIPLWLDEGVAQWAEQQLKPERRRVMKALLGKDMIIPLSRFMSMDVRGMNEDTPDQTPGLLVSGPDGYIKVDQFSTVKQFYLQAFSLVDFLISVDGANTFAVFCRQLREGKTLDEALRFAYPRRMRDITQMEKEWMHFVEEQY